MGEKSDIIRGTIGLTILLAIIAIAIYWLAVLWDTSDSLGHVGIIASWVILGIASIIAGSYALTGWKECIKYLRDYIADRNL